MGDLARTRFYRRQRTLIGRWCIAISLSVPVILAGCGDSSSGMMKNDGIVPLVKEIGSRDYGSGIPDELVDGLVQNIVLAHPLGKHRMKIFTLINASDRSPLFIFEFKNHDAVGETELAQALVELDHSLRISRARCKAVNSPTLRLKDISVTQQVGNINVAVRTAEITVSGTDIDLIEIDCS